MGSNRKSKKQEQSRKQRKKSVRELLPPDWDILAVILVLAVALRMWFALTYDATLYDEAGEGVRLLGAVRGAAIDSASPPLYVVFLRICLSIFGRGAAQAAFVINGIAGTVSVALIYYIAAAISSRTTAVISAAISALYINYIMAGLALSPRVPGILAILVITIILVRGKAGKRSNCITGAVLGLGILIDPFLIFYLPGFMLVSARRWLFLGAVLVVVLPWAVRNSVREGVPVPVYSQEAVDLDLGRWKIGDLRDFTHVVDKLYVNGAMLCSRGAGWVEPPGSRTSDNIRNSTTFGAYMYMLTALAGLVGLLRYHSREHRVLLLPSLVYLGFLVLFSTCRTTNRLLAEHIVIFYLAILLSLVVGRFRARSVDLPSSQ